MSTQHLQNPIAVVASAVADDVREAARRARAHGFAGLEVPAYAPALNLPDLSASGRRELRSLLAREQQPLVAVRCDLDPRGFGPGADVDRALARLDRALESAMGLGAACVCTDLGPLPPASVVETPKPSVTPEQAGLIILPSAATAAPASPTPPPAPPDPGFLSQMHAALGELCAKADRYRMHIALSSSLASFASLHQAVAAVNCPWFGVDLDPVAILRDAWDVDEVLSAIGPLVRHVRGRDAVRGADQRTRPAVVGQGSVDWRRLLAAFDEAGYTGAITIDPTELPDRARAALAAQSHLRAL